MTENRYFAVFGHFYQPPRFNPWTEEIDLDPSVRPFHDWNDKITHECYEANAYAIIEDSNGYAEALVNNYESVTFSFGPLLLEYLSKKHPKVLEAIVDADKESASKYGGHGNAIAQPYAHIILPLAKRPYKEVDIEWGLKYFRRFFEREPEGFWLPEAAVDYETLEILADHGIEFVVLGPHQLKSEILKDGSRRPLREDDVDFRKVYKVPLPSGKEIKVVVYDKWLSGLVAFGDLLKNGSLLARRVLERFREGEGPQLVSIAVDGETFGHHKPGGEAELAKAIRAIADEGVFVTNYAYFVKVIARPAADVEIAERTSWSCPHGVERWRSNCGCGSEIRPGWTQEWRAPLREAVDWLSDEALKAFESLAPKIFTDPDAAVRGYADLLPDREPGLLSRFLSLHVTSADENSRSQALELLELYRHAILMQSSDAWFFEDIFRPEPMQAMSHMKRVVELIKGLTGKDLEPRLREILRKAVSNVTWAGTGEDIYDRAVKSSYMPPEKLMSTLSMRMLFENVPPESDYYSYRVIIERLTPFRLGRARGLVGQATLISKVTWRHYRLMFASLYYSWYDVYGGSKPLMSTEEYSALEKNFADMFSKGLMPDIVTYLSEFFKEGFVDLSATLKDDRREIMYKLLESSMADLSRQFDQLYETYAPLMEYLKQTGLDYPTTFRYLAMYYINKMLVSALATEPLNPRLVVELMEWARTSGAEVSDEVREILVKKILDLLGRLRAEPSTPEAVSALESLVEVYMSLGPDTSSVKLLRREFLRFVEDVLSKAEGLEPPLLAAYKNVAKMLLVKL